eukprot:1408544-Amphidinium_carterae.1
MIGQEQRGQGMHGNCRWMPARATCTLDVRCCGSLQRLRCSCCKLSCTSPILWKSCAAHQNGIEWENKCSHKPVRAHKHGPTIIQKTDRTDRKLLLSPLLLANNAHGDEVGTAVSQ